ncbi:MAG: DNA-binding response regulator [Ferruginibacter sp.]|uniref:LytR/AlgR family response regulator transcription factor n=1 Tax=Ferruginibacter sp. TaxID=1940288 RepID=UPI00265855CC|nr:LytTR family DNA-binding domain-containing protein [Ferruginibacter sp.]MDB5280216.1 DNA-binding response regulator [Ferruginibacter sp.]
MISSCMIVDEEPIARDILKNYISRLPMLNLVKVCSNATEAYEGLHVDKVDLLFLDIQMPVISGVEFLKSLRNPPSVIFTTAFSKFAIEGYELNIIDYLLKPITFERFNQVVQKFMERTAKTTADTRITNELPAYTFIKHESGLIRIDYDEVNYIMADKDYCTIFFTNGKKLLIGMHLKLLEGLLPGNAFVRVHRSYIVNLKHIKLIKGNIINIADDEIPIGANYKEALFDKLRLP